MDKFMNEMGDFLTFAGNMLLLYIVVMLVVYPVSFLMAALFGATFAVIPTTIITYYFLFKGYFSTMTKYAKAILAKTYNAVTTFFRTAPRAAQVA